MAVVTYKCPNCDGGLVFDPQSGQFHCEYCNSSFTEEMLAQMSPDSQQEQPDADETASEEQTADQKEQSADGGVIYSCPSCGAQIVTDETTAATYCYYCHNPVVLAGRLSGEWTPDLVLPFAIEREKAVEMFLKWVKKRLFIPRAFFNKKQIEKLTGVYMPYWAVDCSLSGQMDAHGTQVRSWRSGDTQYTETKHFRILREGDFYFPQITMNALHSADEKFAQEVQPFDLTGVKDFALPYLQGFQAQKRDLGEEDLAASLQSQVEEYTQRMLENAATGYALSGEQVQTQLRKADFRYLLLPVWLLTYEGRNKKRYYYAMNGQTGKVCGELPVDYGRLGVLFGIVAALLFAILTLGGYLL